MSEVVATPLAAALPHAAQEPEILVVGLDFRCASLELRERVALNGEEAEAAMADLVARPEIGEAFVLSTCNRTEVYLVPVERDAAFRAAMDRVFAPRAPEVEPEGHFFVLHDRDAARHLLAVAAGLESMVLGEPEIVGQVKRAGDRAAGAGSAGTVLRRLLRAALETGARARNETEIGEGAVSLGYAVVELARQIFNRLETRSCVILGAGETAGMAARALVEKGMPNLHVANRDPKRAMRFVEEFPGAQRVEFDARYQAMESADLVVASTGADEPVVVWERMREVMRARPGKPLLVVDLGVPRQVDGRVRRLENVFVHDIDSLQSLLDRNLERRRTQVPKVERVVAEELEHFTEWFRGLRAEPLIAQIQRRAEEIRRRELDSVRGRFPAELQDDLERMTRALVRKILHHPSNQLRAKNGSRTVQDLELVRELFQLGDEGDEKR